MQISFSKSAAAGLYRSRCCRHTVTMATSKILPLCPRCRAIAEWELVVRRTAGPKPAPAGLSSQSDAA